MVKNLISNLILACLSFTLFREFYIVASYHHIQFEEKVMIETYENSKNLHFGLDLGLLGPNSGRHFFFIKLVVRYSSKLSFCVI